MREAAAAEGSCGHDTLIVVRNYLDEDIIIVNHLVCSVVSSLAAISLPPSFLLRRGECFQASS
jgi:hypothetical protein